MEQIGHSCLCNCGKVLNGTRDYFPGHKPKRAKKTHEERSKISRQMWDRRGRVKIEFHPCACGCEEMVKGKWKRGHHSRVQNISKREDIRKLRRENFKKLHDEGKLKPWNRGLTKDTDERVARNVVSLLEKVHSEESRKMHSELMRKHRLDGTIPTLRGPQHSQWNGGTSTIIQRMRGSHQLYEQWKRPILVRDGFKCQECGEGGNLEVHHNGERFAEIVRKIIFQFRGKEGLERELTFDEGTHIIAAVVDYHTRNQVPGLTLCEECHNLEHNHT